MISLITNIKELLQVRNEGFIKVSGLEMKTLPTIKNAFLLIKDDLISDYGEMQNLPKLNPDVIIDAQGKIVLPAWCDSHTHIVYAGNREDEFVDRINGLSYEEIANKGGGILNSAKKLQKASEEELYIQASNRIEEAMALGTAAIEIKSGYGLTVEAELKMLRVIKKLSHDYPVAIKATFLGAHAFPEEFKEDKEAYIDLICNEMIPKVANEKLAEFVDVFCETGYFSVSQTNRILKKAKQFGLVPKIHVNQFTSIGGVQIGVKNLALSVDHLEILTDKDLEELKNSNTMPVALPACSYFLTIPYTPAREIIDAGLPLALASDFNPGSSPSGNMNFVVSTACIKMRMTPEESINAATINGAYAMNISSSHGSITRGKKANLIITKQLPSYSYIPYAFGSNLIDTVIVNGKII
jgi:imidazolonepropionase